MKNQIIIVLLLCSLLIPIHVIFAIGVSSPFAPLGSQANPIYVQSGGDSGVTNSYISAGSSYGVPSGYKCTYNASQYANEVVIALKNLEIEIVKAENNPNTPKLDTMSLYVFKGQLMGNFGQYLNNCANIDLLINRLTVPIIQTISDQVCKETSGANSYYSGETDVNKGGGIGGCGCMSGYQFDHGNYGQCVVTPQAQTPVVSNTPAKESTACPDGFTCTQGTPSPATVTCPVGYTCTMSPNAPAIGNCPAGYVCTPNNQPITPVAPVVPASSNTTVSFTYHANLVEQITKRDMTVISPANLRSCPNETCQSLGKYPKDTIFEVTQRYNDVFGCYGGTTPDGKEGWIYPAMLADRVDNSKNEIASSSAATSTNSQSELSTSTYVNNFASTSTNALPQKGLWARVKGWFGF